MLKSGKKEAAFLKHTNARRFLLPNPLLFGDWPQRGIPMWSLDAKLSAKHPYYKISMKDFFLRLCFDENFAERRRAMWNVTELFVIDLAVCLERERENFESFILRKESVATIIGRFV